MADAYPYPLLVELEESNIPRLKTKLVKYFQSKKSNGGDCEVQYDSGGRTAVLRFRNEEDQQRVLEKQAHQLSWDKGLLRMTVRSLTLDKPAQEEPPSEDVRKPNVAAAKQQPAAEDVSLTVGSEAETKGRDDDPGDEELSSTAVVIGNITWPETEEFLEMLVENILRNPDTPADSQNFILQYTPEIQSAVVSFQSGKEKDNFLTRCPENRMFMKKGFSIRPLELTEKVVVEDIVDVKEDLLRLYFEGRFGEVEEITINEEEQSAVITFKEYQAVKKTLEKKHHLQQKEIRVYPFYESLGLVFYGKDKPSLKLPAAVSEPIDSAVCKFLNHKPSAAETVHSDLAVHFCKANLSQPAVVLSPVESLLHQPDAKAAVKGWRDAARSAFAKSVSKFKPLKFQLEADAWVECEAKVRQTLRSEEVLVVPDQAKGVLSVVGLESVVDRLQADLSDLVAATAKRAQREKLSVTQEVKVTPSAFHLMCEDGVKDRLLQVYPEIKMSHEGTHLKVTGIHEEIIATNRVILEAMLAMKRQDLEVDDSVLELLKGEQSQQEELTRALLISQGINAALDISAHRVQLFAGSDRDLRVAQAHLSQCLISERIEVEDGNILEKPEWLHLVGQLESGMSGLCRTVIRIDCSQVVVSGRKDSVTKVSKKLDDFIYDNTLIEEAVAVKSKAILEYVKNLRESWLDQLDGRVAVTYKRDKICLSGTRADVTDCKVVVHDLLSSVFFDVLKFDKPGVKKFFKHKESTFVSLIKNETGCLACLVDEGGGSQDSISHAPKPAYQLQTADGVDIAVSKADMCSYPVHAVVNSSNLDLKHNGGLAAALLNAAGPQLQHECDKYVSLNGQLKPGDCMVTGAGGQLACRKVIHVVAPKFEPAKPQKALAQLKRGVKGSLELAEVNGCDSVAIPAISRGLGFPLPLCAITIVKAVKEYCDENCDDGPMKMIHFVNNDDGAVRAFEDAVRQEFGSHGASSSLKASPPHGAESPLGTNVAPDPILCHVTTKEGVSITLKKGYIEAATTEVTVNTVFEDLTLNKGAVSNAILRVAGPKLQQQISAKQPSGNFGEIIVTDGCQLKSSQVFHAVTPQWDKGQGTSEKILTGIFRDCLNKAEDAGLTSISFPAIGTGNLAFPKDLVASKLLDEISVFSSKRQPKHLKKVVIIIFPGDVQTLQAFSDTFQKKFSNATSTLPSTAKSSAGPFSKVVSKPGQHQTTMGSVTVQVVSGDLTKETSDVIVNSSNDNFTLKSGVSKAILEAAGQAVETECLNLGAQPHQGMILTQPGNLKCKQILHLAGQTDPVKIFNVVKEALQMCASKNYTSVSFPAIGTGQGGVRAKQVADSMLDAVIDVLGKNTSSSLTTVRIVIFQPPMLNDFNSSMQEREISDQKSKGLWEKFKSIFVGDTTPKPQKGGDFFVSPLKVEPTCFHICGNSQARVDAAKQWINDLISKEMHLFPIQDQAILGFSDADRQKIVAIQMNLGVSITTESKNEQASILIEGIGMDVIQANTEIQKILRDVKNQEELQKKVNLASIVADWQYKQKGLIFKSFDPMTNYKLEEAFENNLPIKVTISGQDYTVTMPKGPATDSQGGTLEIKRIDKLKGEQLPEHWDPMPANATSHAVPLKPGTTEYTDVLTLFQASCNRSVTKIERIQNPALWKSLMIMKRHMEDKNGHPNNDRQLFHGTCETTVSTINEYGFNRSYAGKNAACYGNGSYFAVNAQYSASDTYSKPNQKMEKFMYLCRVLTGDFTLGKSNMIVPPAKGAGSVHLYDSVVDNVTRPSMFIVFHDTQAYPEYLITFK